MSIERTVKSIFFDVYYIYFASIMRVTLLFLHLNENLLPFSTI